MVVDRADFFLRGSSGRWSYLSDLDSLVILGDAERQETRRLNLSPRISPMYGERGQHVLSCRSQGSL
jgi:hypothetical protein